MPHSRRGKGKGVGSCLFTGMPSSLKSHLDIYSFLSVIVAGHFFGCTPRGDAGKLLSCLHIFVLDTCLQFFGSFVHQLMISRS